MVGRSSERPSASAGVAQAATQLGLAEGWQLKAVQVSRVWRGQAPTPPAVEAPRG